MLQKVAKSTDKEAMWLYVQLCLRRNLNHVWIQFHRSVSSPCVWVFVKVQCEFKHFCSGFATFTSRFAVSWGRGRENGEGLVARGQREGSHGTRNGNEKTKNLHIHCKKSQIHKLRTYPKNCKSAMTMTSNFHCCIKV